jgi:hypothetical protein
MPDALKAIRASPGPGSSSSSSVISHGLHGSLMIAALVRMFPCYTRGVPATTRKMDCPRGPPDITFSAWVTAW